MGDVAEADEGGNGEEEASEDGLAGAALVGPVAEEGGEEGGEDEGEEDQARGGGGEGEEVGGVEGEDGVPGCEEGGLREGGV